MLQRVHMVPLDAREGNEAEPDDDHFSIVSGSLAYEGPTPRQGQHLRLGDELPQISG